MPLPSRDLVWHHCLTCKLVTICVTGHWLQKKLITISNLYIMVFNFCIEALLVWFLFLLFFLVAILLVLLVILQCKILFTSRSPLSVGVWLLSVITFLLIVITFVIKTIRGELPSEWGKHLFIYFFLCVIQLGIFFFFFLHYIHFRAADDFGTTISICCVCLLLLLIYYYLLAAFGLIIIFWIICYCLF